MFDSEGKEKRKWFPTGVDAGTDDKKKAKNIREAKKRMNEILAEIEQQNVVYSPEIKFLDWVDKWMEQKKGEVRLITYEGYESYLKIHIRPFFEPLKLTLSAVTPQHIQDFYNAEKKTGKSTKSVREYALVIRGALKDAVEKNMLPYNPADRTKLPKKNKYVAKFYTEAQASTLLSVLKNQPVKPAVVIGLFYGLRRSEVAGLRWQDIDFDSDAIHIRNTVVRLKTTVEAEQTKSESSNRTLFIIPETKEYLMSLRHQQRENRLLMGESYQVNDHVCTWPNGKPLAIDYITGSFRRLLENNNLPIIRFHDLRHTAGSLLLEKKLSMKQIQEFLGHSDISTTMNIYAHLSDEGKKEVAVVMGQTLSI